MTMNTRLAAPAVILAGIVLAPFLDKAYTVDDAYFLFQAEQVLKEPLNPSGFDIVWDAKIGRASRLSPSGPGMAYILAPTLALGGGEWMAHASVFLLLALGAWSTVALARRLGLPDNDARTAGLLLVSAPAVLAMSATAMPDVPAMALGVLGLERLLAFRASGRALPGVLAALALGLAVLCRSHTVVLWLVGAILVSGVDSLRSLRGYLWRKLWPLVGAASGSAAGAWLTRDAQTGSVSLMSSIDFLRPDFIPHNLLSFFCHWVLLIPLAIVWAALHLRRLSYGLFVACSLLALLPLWLRNELGWWWVAPIAALGATVFVDVMRQARASGESDRIALAVWLLAAIPVCVYVSLAGKYLVVSAPAAALSVALVLRSRPRLVRRCVVGGWLVGCLLLSVLILRADARMAGQGRRAAAELIEPQVEAGKTVWYSGDWGFKWYADKAGAWPIDGRAERERPGDLVVQARERPGRFGRRPRRPIQSIALSGPSGRIMDRSVGAGFYSNGWGYLPWCWGNREIHRYDLVEVIGRRR
jgi:hypothetical protein